MIYLRLVFSFLKLGLFGFGGGYAILTLIWQEAGQFDLMTLENFRQLVALSQITPGPIAINAATYVGYQSAGVGGALLATAALLFPSVVLILLISRFMDRFRTGTLTQHILSGVRPVTVGMLLAAGIFLTEGSIVSDSASAMVFFQAPLLFFQWGPMLICGLTLVFHLKKHVSPIRLILLAAALGALFVR